MMKLGIVSAILSDYNFEQVIDLAEAEKLKCVEIMCWPIGKATRRYGGVTHIDVCNLTKEKILYYQNYIKKRDIEISSLAYYVNPLDDNLEHREVFITHLYRLIDAAKLLDVNCITTFIGRNRKKNLDENLKEMIKIWTPIIKYAHEKGVKVAIENCPMYYTEDEWPNGDNIACTPYAWRYMFEKIPYDNLGLNYDPSHMLLQGADYIKPIYDFKDRLFHIHIKDIKMYQDKIDEFGMFGYPAEFHSPKLPGLGQVNWSKFMSALYDIHYNGCVCIEVEDKAFEDSQESINQAINMSVNYIKNYYPRM